jgi:hypothetical protein
MSTKPRRDLRLDVFRGLALFFIFVDHIPYNQLSAFTVQALGFFDAAEVFIFISGYTAALVYGRSYMRDGFLVATAQVYRRVWQLYVAHLFLFIVLSAIVSYVIQRAGSPLYAEELGVGDFLAEPHVALVRALTLEFQPTFLDILPLYIVLLAVFPLVLMALQRSPWLALLPSLALYAAVYAFDLRFRGYPNDQPWFFNHLAWQLLFVVGAAAGFAKVAGHSITRKAKWLVWPALAIAVVAFTIEMSWVIHRRIDAFPALFLELLWPLNKTDLSPVRLINFLAATLVAAWLIRPDAAWLSSAWIRPVALCGKFSLHVFCFGIILSLLGHFVLVELSASRTMQIAVTASGALAMYALARLLAWYRDAVETRSGASA